MILYHYLPIKNTVITDGLLSVSRLPEELQKYAERAGSNQVDQIRLWLNKTFPNRDRSIAVLTEPIRCQGTDPMLKEWVNTRQLITIDFDKLIQDSLIESVWCKEKSDTGGDNEIFRKITIDEIDTTPLSWEKCNAQQGLFFGAVRHYFLVLRNGIIPPSYLTMKGI